MRRFRGQGAAALSVMILIGTWLPGHLAPAAGAPADVVREGIITSVGADALTVAFAASPTPPAIPVRVSAATRVTRRQKTTLEAIKPGDYLAVTSKRGADGGLTMEFAERVEGRTLFLKYREGATAIAVPASTEIVVSRLDELRKGMHVLVRGVVDPDGSIAASSITGDES